MLVDVGQGLSAGVLFLHPPACIAWSGSLWAGEEGKARERQAVVRVISRVSSLTSSYVPWSASPLACEEAGSPC